MCLGKHIRGRENTCCFGCSTAFGIFLIGLFVCAEEVFFFYDFVDMYSSDEWNFGVFVWLFVGAARVFFWLWMCCDTIHKRKYFLWTMIITWLIQVALFVNIQGELFTGPDNYCAKQHVLEHMVDKWGISCGWAITMLELFSIINLAAFGYFTAVAYEHFHLGTKNKKLLEKEAHRKEVMKASLETQKRLKAQQQQMAMDAEVERRRSEMSQRE